MDKPNTWIRHSSNTSMYIVTTSKITDPNSYLLQSLPTIMLWVLLLVFLHSSLLSEHLCSSQTRYCFLSSLWLCCRPQWITEYPQSWNFHGPTALSEIHWCVTFPRSWFQSRWQSLCQSSVFPNHSAFKETLWKISWTLWNHCSAWYSIVHSLSSRVYVLCLPSLPCVYARTHHIQHFLQENTTSPHSSHNWWGTWIWNFLDSGF